MGIEKVVPTWRDLEVFLQLLPRSSTGERMNPYTSMWTGVTPGDGPQEFHLVLLDNGRTATLADPAGRAALRCIRCSACLNVCPVYERTGGHAYGSVYPGPIGAVLSPQLPASRTTSHCRSRLRCAALAWTSVRSRSTYPRCWCIYGREWCRKKAAHLSSARRWRCWPGRCAGSGVGEWHCACCVSVARSASAVGGELRYGAGRTAETFHSRRRRPSASGGCASGDCAGRGARQDPRRVRGRGTAARNRACLPHRGDIHAFARPVRRPPRRLRGRRPPRGRCTRPRSRCPAGRGERRRPRRRSSVMG